MNVLPLQTSLLDRLLPKQCSEVFFICYQWQRKILSHQPDITAFKKTIAGAREFTNHLVALEMYESRKQGKGSKTSICPAGNTSIPNVNARLANYRIPLYCMAEPEITQLNRS
jgi:hypothetical protein